MLTFIDQSLVLLAWEQVLINIGASHLRPREKVVKLDKFLSLSTLNKRTNLRTHCRQNLFFGNNRIYNIAGKFVYPNSIARACFIFQLCALMTSANKSLEEKIFHRVENVIKQLVHTSAVRSSRYEALGKFGEHSRS